jgi:hypothetical protein
LEDGKSHYAPARIIGQNILHPKVMTIDVMIDVIGEIAARLPITEHAHMFLQVVSRRTVLT